MRRVFFLTFLLMTASGCLFGKKEEAPVVVDPVLPPSMGRHELVDYLNAQCDGLTSWRSRDTSVHVRTPQIPMPQKLRGSLACSSPSNFRLVANNVLAQADFGSNQDFCWAYAKPGESVVLTWRHEDSHLLRHVPGGLPRLEPEWLMTILGIRPLNADDYEVQNPPSGSREIWLVDIEDVEGSTLRRVIKVDTLRGVVREHALYDGDGVALLRAQLSNYRNCNGAKLPHEVKISFPTHETELTLVFNNVETNCSIPDTVWTPPRGANLEYVDLGDVVRQHLKYEGAHGNDKAPLAGPSVENGQASIDPVGFESAVPEFDETADFRNYEESIPAPTFDEPRAPAKRGIRRFLPWLGR